MSKMLKASKSIMAIADLNHNSPSQVSSQNVNVVINNPQPDKSVSYPDNNDSHEAFHEASQQNPYNALPRERDIDSAMTKTEEMTESIEDKDNVIKALTLIIEILQNNPLIVNKFVVAEKDVLQELILLIVSADSVDVECGDIECSCTTAKYRNVKRIYIKKDETIYSVEQCPVILRLFDNYKISLLLVI